MENTNELNEDNVCPDCQGTGEIPEDEFDDDGNIQKGVGIKMCHCRINE